MQMRSQDAVYPSNRGGTLAASRGTQPFRPRGGRPGRAVGDRLASAAHAAFGGSRGWEQGQL
eukprot:10480017-Lingulodinium_polyedra.AAC.1